MEVTVYSYKTKFIWRSKIFDVVFAVMFASDRVEENRTRELARETLCVTKSSTTSVCLSGTCVTNDFM